MREHRPLHAIRPQRLLKLAGLLLVLALVAAACSGSGDESEATAEAVDAGEEASEAGSSGEQSDPGVPDPNFDYATVNYDLDPAGDALRDDRRNAAFPPPVIEPSLIRSGGVPPDGIPPIDSPNFVPTSDVDFLTDDEAVVSVEIDGDARAYPVQILIWHEIVNDEIGGIPVSVTYCPLCNSALAFDRRFGDRVLDFGTSGELYQSALVMYDRQTGSLWAHFTGQGLVGHYAGAELGFVPAQTISFAQFRAAHPEGQVLTQDTGASRQYGVNPYVGYDNENTDPIGQFFNGEIDRSELAKARIVGINDDAGSIAIRFEDLASQPVVQVTEDGRNLVVFHIPGLASALDVGQISEGRDVGQTGVFTAAAPDGTALTFTNDGENFVDDQTGTTWNILGQGIDGELAGERLEPITHLDTFWFAWATYRPGTVVIEI